MAMPSVPPEIGTAMKVWQSKDHEFYYPDPNPTVPRAQNLVGRDWAVAKANKLLGAMKESHDKAKAKNSYDYPIRTELANLTPNPQTIMTNHFELRTHNTTFHEYEILDLEAAGQSRRKIQALFRKAIAQWPFLRDNQDHFATDGQKTIVSWKNLNQDIENSEKTVRITNQINGASIWEVKITTGGTDVTARISHVGAVNIDALLRQTRCDISQSGEDRSSVERCINILISKSFNNDVVKSTGKKFYVRSARSELGGSVSLEIIRGYYYAVQPAIGSLLLNFNVATSAFFKPILVSEFLEDQRTFVLPRRQDLLKRLRVYVEREHKEKRLNNKGARIKSVTAIGSENIGKLFFFKKQLGTDGKPYKLDNGEWAREKVPTTVVQHHLDVFNLKVKPDRPAVNVGSPTEPVWYAQEVLRIIPYQIYTRTVPEHLTSDMVEKAAYNPDVSQALIEREGLRCMGFDTVQNNEVNLRNGVPISLYPTMLKVPSARLPFPPVFYRLTSGKVSPNPKRGSGWNLTDDESFYSVIKPPSLKYLLITTIPTAAEARPVMARFDRELRFQMNKRLGMNVNHVTLINKGGDYVPDLKALKTLLETAKSQHANLVVLMLHKHDRFNYSKFKTMADCEFGLPSICLAKPKVFQDQESRKYMTNIAQKINIKLGGYNAQVEGVEKSLGKDTLVLGADVVHPGHGGILDAPSIACIVGSVDNEGGRFLGSARLQSKDKKDREIIDHVQEMVVERIRAWMKLTGSTTPPANIIYYRDGVSEGQYRQVRDIELKAIEAAHGTFAPAGGGKTLNIPGKNAQGGVKITAIVGVKRHHTRFYPILDKDKDKFGNQNCLPGTWVDRVVTSPYYNDFYLQSHSGIKGTARPTHYFILRNDGINSCKSTDALRQLTHRLCYTYCRATTGISYATPTYYADRLCDRARLYLRNTWSGTDAEYLTRLDTAKANHLESRQRARDAQFRNGQPFQPGGTKTPDELQDEAGDEESLRVFAREYALTYAKEEFYGRTNNLDGDPGNPWHRDLNGIMFWM